VTDLQASRWAVVWWVEGHRHEANFDDRALADAYAVAHHGQVVPLAALVPWPTMPVGNFSPT
jgi:hypothetical protein